MGHGKSTVREICLREVARLLKNSFSQQVLCQLEVPEAYFPAVKDLQSFLFRGLLL
jgi:hypothetical protein